MYKQKIEANAHEMREYYSSYWPTMVK